MVLQFTICHANYKKRLHKNLQFKRYLLAISNPRSYDMRDFLKICNSTDIYKSYVIQGQIIMRLPQRVTTQKTSIRHLISHSLVTFKSTWGLTTQRILASHINIKDMQDLPEVICELSLFIAKEFNPIRTNPLYITKRATISNKKSQLQGPFYSKCH